MSSIITFPFQDPEQIPERPVKKLVLGKCQGEFPTLPFIGVKPISELVPLGDSPLSRIRHRQPAYPEVGIGFYWWMGKERSTEFLGFSPDPHEAISHQRLSLNHLWRAWFVLRQVPFIDVGHENRGSTLSYCWGVASLGANPEWSRKIHEHFGVESFNRLYDLAKALAESRAGRDRSVRALSPLFKTHKIPYRP